MSPKTTDIRTEQWTVESATSGEPFVRVMMLFYARVLCGCNNCGFGRTHEKEAQGKSGC
jgi:hypothetical protein